MIIFSIIFIKYITQKHEKLQNIIIYSSRYNSDMLYINGLYNIVLDLRKYANITDVLMGNIILY